ncbi:hypothetical protein TVAG_248650 [Trichomonas vaginalis G3]|uniref:Uncharacterized protein n=1 Tax=Trichomonas vaginalis (strain ATCC PRA-98 / G3) TaxID=412133 RepID=A2E7A1_TRIV3|nr:spectrin binding [Trichomonas vaginalis G3]EAY11498.1 hypothetical protein TVAG_248650 [Trichomonas vaginalis G3]KAI5526739.1 spectrin binding [Trichomonas vaginalis G3]|eukprot:XP_001323721.1 hypothetical protein [Trichomonas vaginalis G3]
MTPRPKNYKLTSFLYYKGIKFEDSEPYYSEERIQNLYETDSPLYYIAWDKIDELKSKFPKLKVNKKIDFEITPLDCAIKYGSELCFNYLKNQGGEYTEKSAEYAIKGGNINIFEQMIENGQSFDGMINTALIYHHYKIAEYLHTNFGQIPNSPAKFMYYGSYDVVSYLPSNGADINDIHTFNIYHYFRKFSFI